MSIPRLSVFDAPTFRPCDVALLTGVCVNTITDSVRKSPGFPAPIKSNWQIVWTRNQWPAVLVALFACCPKARRNAATKLGLCLKKTLGVDLVREVLGNPFKLMPSAT